MPPRDEAEVDGQPLSRIAPGLANSSQKLAKNFKYIRRVLAGCQPLFEGAGPGSILLALSLPA